MIESTKKGKIIDIIDTILTIIVFASVIHYIFMHFEKYYMISYFMIPFMLKIVSILIEKRDYYDKRLSQGLNFAILTYLIVAYILTMSFSAVDNFLLITDKFLFPFFYYKDVEFSYWIVVIWIFLGMIKNKILSLLLSIGVFIFWLLMYNLW